MTGLAPMSFLDGAVTLHHGDCFDVIRTLADYSIDSVCTDPPYALTQNKKGGSGDASVNLNSPAGRSRISTGAGCILKPGGHLVALSGARTYHRLACAIEDAGFEIRDQLQWIYSQGFPKSHDVSKGIDKAAGVEREVSYPEDEYALRSDVTKEQRQALFGWLHANA